MRAAYVVLDIETTGLDPQNDQILEVGAIAVDDKLEELSRFHTLIHCDLPIERWKNLAEVVKHMHTVNGLWGQCANPWLESEAMADLALHAWLEQHAGPQVILMGNSVHFDHAFLKARFPATAAKLHYRVMDIGGLARWLRDFGYPVDGGPPMPHRGLEDAEIELDEARKLRTMAMRGAPAAFGQ